MENKEEPMKPNRYYFNKYLFKCGRCRRILDIVEHDYCPQCGQRIDWSEYPIGGDAMQKAIDEFNKAHSVPQ